MMCRRSEPEGPVRFSTGTPRNVHKREGAALARLKEQAEKVPTLILSIRRAPMRSGHAIATRLQRLRFRTLHGKASSKELPLFLAHQRMRPPTPGKGQDERTHRALACASGR